MRITVETDSILNSIKKLLGIAEEYEHFDLDLIIHINSVMMVLNQLGIGSEDPFYIKDSTDTWSNFLGEDIWKLEMVKTYVYLKVRKIFDPPTSSSAMEALNSLISEFEWRLNVAAEN